MFTDQFKRIWFVDFEYQQTKGNLPIPICMVAKELRSQKVMRYWQDDLSLHSDFDCGKDSAFVAYYSSAELGCFLALDWPFPTNIIDLYAEFRCVTNGRDLPNGNGLLGALAWYGIDSISVVEKESNRSLILRGNYTSQEKTKIMDYCETDVISLEKLFNAMSSVLSPYALIRGRYMKAVAIMEKNGIPIDGSLLVKLKRRWGKIQDALIKEVDKEFGVYDETTFKYNRFVTWLRNHGISWPTLPSSRLALDDETFKDMGKLHPLIEPLRQLRSSLSQMRLSELEIGSDNRNRCLLSPYRSRTGRNQPSTSKFIFGPAVWLRGLIKPEYGKAIAYIDYEQQEFAIAAALSKDPFMVHAYQSGDPYLEFAKLANAVPSNVTKKSFSAKRELFKQTCLGLNYGMGPASLALRLGVTKIEAKDFIRMHKTIFKKFWSWSDAIVDYAKLKGELFTVFNWKYYVDGNPNHRSLQNFPVQANGAEILRLACCLTTERGVKVCAPIHDALLIEASEINIEEAIRVTQEAMRKASEIVLNSFPLRSEAKIVRYPDRYMDERGAVMWATVMRLLDNGHDGEES